MALSLSIDLAWDEQKFGFMGKTEQTFALWKHFSDNLESGMKPVAALRAARVQTADERQAIKDMENSLPGPGK